MNDWRKLIFTLVLFTIILSAFILIQNQSLAYPLNNSNIYATDYNASLGLELRLSLIFNTSNPKSIIIKIDVFNALPYLNNVPASDKWIIRGLTFGPCNSINFPVGIAISFEVSIH